MDKLNKNQIDELFDNIIDKFTSTDSYIVEDILIDYDQFHKKMIEILEVCYDERSSRIIFDGMIKELFYSRY